LVELGCFSWPARLNTQADKTALAAGIIDISQYPAEIPRLPAPL